MVQDLRYTYDPAGNITRIEDAALQTIFHGGQQVDPVCTYTYDAVYRLIEAEGPRAHRPDRVRLRPPAGDAPRLSRSWGCGLTRTTRRRCATTPRPTITIRSATFAPCATAPNGGSWTRRYVYEAASLLEPATKQSNRLTSTTMGNGPNRTETYTYDAHGNMLTINGTTAGDDPHPTTWG